MAEINVERKSSNSWIWWLLAIIVLALLLWWLLADDEVDPVVATTPVVTPTTTPEPIATGPLCVAQALSAPATYVGQTLGTCQLRVTEVPTDRGFWVEENGQRMFVLLIDGPAEAPVDINPGQTITMSSAVLRDRAFLPQVPGESLDQDTRNIIDQQAEYFLVVDESNITILSPGS